MPKIAIPGAVNLPALSNAEHAEIGILYKSSPFAARLRGAGLLASNIAAHLQNHFASRPPQWRPLIYCRRGGQRSGAVVEVLCRIGWQATALCGGYKRYRQIVLDGIAAIAPTIRWAVIGGKTGAGKNRHVTNLAQQRTIHHRFGIARQSSRLCFWRLRTQPATTPI